MERYFTIILSSLLVSLSLTACSNNQNQTPANNPDVKTEQNSKQPVPQSKRIVALTPLAADTVYNLDKTKLVAVPNGRYIEKVAKDKFANFPKVGVRGNINIEQIVSLKPDLVIGSETFQGQALNKLKELGINTVVHETRAWSDLENLTKDLAERIGADPKPLLDKYQSFLANIPENGKSVVFLVSTQPTLSPNKDSWAGDLLQKFNYKNVTADLQAKGRFKGYLTLSQEQILAKNPDKIFIMESDNVNPESFNKLSFWNQLKASQNNQVYVFHHDGLVSPTSLDTVEEVTKKLREAASK
jgi:iron complex transport system substrate-binding protein